MSASQASALQIESLFAGYGRYDVIKDVSLTVGEGEAVAILGANGAGKTTLLRAIMGLVKQRRGRVVVHEPSLGLAPVAIDAVATALLRLRERGRALPLVEQRVDLALRICDRVCVLAGARSPSRRAPTPST